MAHQGNRNSNTLREEAKQLYRQNDNIRRKWLDQYGSVSRDNAYQQNRACLSELFNMLDIVMEICIEDFRHTHAIISIENGERGAVYTFAGDDGSEVRFNAPNTFALRVRALRAIGYNISDELFYDTRILRNETTHGNQTVVLQHIELGYDETLKALNSIADTLIILGKLDESLRTPTFEMMRIHEGDTLHNGAFMIGALIGEGGTSRVYKANQKRTGRILAVKEMKPGNYTEELIRREGDLLMLLHHQQIPQVHDTFFENGTYYIVMDYIEGVTLERFIDPRTMSGNAFFLHNETEEFDISPDNLDITVAETLMSEKERREFIRALLDVLSYLHSPEVGLVFIDLSPNNIIVDENILPHLIDFGLAGRLGTEQVVPAATIGYAAPEVLAKGTLDERTDIYSFGYILRYLYTGLTPLERTEDSTRELIDDEHIAEVVNRCTARNPEERYASISDLITDLFPEGLEARNPLSKKTYALLLAIASLLVCISIATIRYNKKKSEETLINMQQQTQHEIKNLQEDLQDREETIAEYEGRTYVSPEEAGVDPQETIVWADQNLELAIRNYTGLEDGPICYEDLWSYDTFDLSNYGIQDLTALNKLVNISSLNLSGNNISDLSSIEGLFAVRDLNLSNNIISDLSPLYKLKDLYSLNLNGNNIKFMDVDETWAHLTSLDLSNNPLEKLSIKANLNDLQKIKAAKAELSEIHFEGSCRNLEELDFSENNLKELSALKALPSLKILTLDKNHLDNPDALSEISSLHELSLNGCNIENLQFIEGLSQLKTLSLMDNEITDITSISQCHGLTFLSLDKNSLAASAVSVISGLTNLETLNLENCSLTTIEGFENLTHLKILDISENYISDLSPISHQSGLIHLDAANNNLSGDLDAISELKSLNRLELRGNNINNISSLKNMSELSFLDLSYNCIKDFSPIETLSIDTLQIEGQVTVDGAK